jgi:Family of unknown function (DUF6011)
LLVGVDADTGPVKANAERLQRHVAGQDLAAGLEAFEEDDRCGCCGRALTDPVRVERGIGPEC